MRQLALVLLAAAALAGCKKMDRRQRPPEPISAFSESFPSPDKLVTAHFPSGFKATIGGKNGIILGRNLDDGSDEALSILCIGEPVSRESSAFAKIALTASTSKLNDYKQLTERTTECNGVAGATEVTGTWTDKSSGRLLFRRACAFTRHGHGYSLGYSIPEHFAAAHMPLFQAILEGTQFND